MLGVLQRHLSPSPASARSTAGANCPYAAASASRRPKANAVVAENLLPGNDSSEWDVNGCGDPTIQGFATKMSVLPGAVLELKIDTVRTPWHQCPLRSCLPVVS